jgi:hypothetical protein
MLALRLRTAVIRRAGVVVVTLRVFLATGTIGYRLVRTSWRLVASIHGARVGIIAIHQLVHADAQLRDASVDRAGIIVVAGSHSPELIAVTYATGVIVMPALAGARSAIVHGTRIEVKAVGQDDAALALLTRIRGTWITIITVSGCTAGAFAVHARIGNRASVAVIAGQLVGRVDAPGFRHAQVIGARVVVVAGAFVGLTVAVVVQNIADFDCHVGNFRIVRRTVRGILVTVVVIVEVAEIAHLVIIEILLFRIVEGRAIVVFVCDGVAVLVRCAIHRAGLLYLTQPGLAFAVSAALPAIRRARTRSFRKTADGVPAKTTIHGAFRRILATFADSVAAGRSTILEAHLLVFILATDSIPAKNAVRGADVGILAPFTQAITAGRRAIRWT